MSRLRQKYKGNFIFRWIRIYAIWIQDSLAFQTGSMIVPTECKNSSVRFYSTSIPLACTVATKAASASWLYSRRPVWKSSVRCMQKRKTSEWFPAKNRAVNWSRSTATAMISLQQVCFSACAFIDFRRIFSESGHHFSISEKKSMENQHAAERECPA